MNTLKQREMVPGFLAHGEMALVRKVIVETGLYQTVKIFGYCDSIYAAIALSLREDRHERVAGFFEAARERPRLEEQVRSVCDRFFWKISSQRKAAGHSNDSLTLHGKEFSKRHPAVYEGFCEKLVGKLVSQFNSPASKKLLIDLVGQPALLTSVVYAGGFL